jgi:hypothetical protein
LCERDNSNNNNDMKVSTISYFIGGLGFVFIGLSIAFVSGVSSTLAYDKEKCRELLLEAAERVLGYFGFDRTAFGDRAKKNKKWWDELRVGKFKM